MNNRRRLLALAMAGAVSLASGFAAGPAGATALDWLTGAADNDAGGASVVGVGASSAGRVAVGGTLGGSAVFGKGEPNETFLENRGYSEVFFAGYQPDGRLAWAIQGGFATDASGLAVGPQSDVFGAGGGWGGICWNTTQATTTCVNSQQDFYAWLPFFVRFNKDGYALWLRTIDDHEGGYAEEGPIAVDHRNRAIVAGRYQGPIVFGSGEPNATRLCGDGLYVAQYRPDGRLGWARRALGDYGNVTVPHTVAATDSAGSAVIAGSFLGRAVFAPGLPQRVVLEASGERDVFVAKYNSTGRLLWAIRQGSAGNDAVRGVAVDAERRIFVLAAADGRVTLSRFGPAGSRHFTRTLSGVAAASGIAVDPDGSRLAITGTFHDGATFGAGQQNAVTLKAASGTDDAFVARYGRGGRFLSVEPIVSGGGTESGPAVAIDGQSRIVVSGNGSRPIRVGAGADARVWQLGDLYLRRFAADPAAHAAGADAAAATD